VRRKELKIRKTLYILNLVLLLVLGWIVIRTFIESDSTKPAAAHAQGSGEPVSDRLGGRTELTQKELAEIVSKDIFGHDNAPPTQTNGMGIEPSDNNEPIELAANHLELHGTIAGPPEIAIAIIKDRQKNFTDTYKIGDTISGASILSISKEAVILSENGRKKILKLDASRSQTATTTPDKAPSANQTAKAVPLPAPSRRRIQVLEQILSEAVIKPAVVNNQAIGLQITNLDEIPLAGVLGLHNGDIIQSVNGQQVTNKQKAFQVFRKAKTQPEIVLELIRDGKRERLGFSLR
jgi:general secretion pathway protein C